MRRVVIHAAAAAIVLGLAANRAASGQANAPAIKDEPVKDEKALAASTTAPSAASAVAVSSTSQPSAPGVKEIQTTLGKVVEAATSKGELDTLVSLFAKPERDRMTDARTKSWPDLDGRIDQFRKDWQ